jgi:elongation factor Ts
MSFTAKDVAELRKVTGAGMMKCKEALKETNGDLTEAANYLRKKGVAGAAKKIANVAAEGVLAVSIDTDKKSAAMVEVNCQTDFVAKNADFMEFAKQIAEQTLKTKSATSEELLKSDMNGKPVSEVVLEKISTIGEKIEIRRVSLMKTDGVIGAYVHPVGHKIGSMVALADSSKSLEAADIAMHIAASNPVPEFVSTADVPAEIKDTEKKIEMEKEDLAGKPEEIKEKIVEGRLNKLLAARTLEEQDFIKDPGQKVKDYVKTKIEAFICLKVGEGVEKKNDNFADEVASMMAS